MKNKLTYLLIAAMLLCLLIPQAALAKEIEFEAYPGTIWRLVIPDELYDALARMFANNTPGSPAGTPPPASACDPTPAPAKTPTKPTPPTTPPATDPSAGLKQAQQNSYETQMLSWVNSERAKQRLAPYALDPSLTYWARAKSQDMYEKNYFAHTSPTYGSSYNMLKNGGVSFTASAENIARFGSLEKAHAGLMSSEGHYANIMSKSMQRAGIGVVKTSSGVFYVTQLFVR